MDMMRDRTRVLGRIHTIRATGKRPAGKGWKSDPSSGLYVRHAKSRNMVVLAGLSMMAKSIRQAAVIQ